MVPVADQDEAIAFHTGTLGFELTSDVPSAQAIAGSRSHVLVGGTALDDELMGGDGTVPQLFFFRDHDANTLMIVEGRSARRVPGGAAFSCRREGSLEDPGPGVLSRDRSPAAAFAVIARLDAPLAPLPSRPDRRGSRPGSAR